MARAMRASSGNPAGSRPKASAAEAKREAEAAAQARSRSARNRARVPTVSSNLMGVTATQTIEPYRPGARDDEYVDDR